MTKDKVKNTKDTTVGAKVDEVPKEVQDKIDAGNKQLEQLTVNDLIVIKNVFDACSVRGAFKAEEFQTVGAVYTKLANFLATIMPPKPAEDKTAEETTSEAEDSKGES